ncbi:MAG: YncE family protein [Desulfobulbaceae bacterium]|nr:YncE family protein [Desulfobulbaceae bacterium]
MKARLSGLHTISNLLVLFWGIFFLAGCQQGGTVGGDSLSGAALQESSGDARLSVFLRLKEPEGPNLWMKISNLEVGSHNTWFPLRAARAEIQRQDVRSNGQILAGRGGVPAGQYQSIRFTVEKAALDRDGEMIFLSVDNPVVEIDFPAELNLAKGDSTSLFLTWDTAGSMQGAAIIRPKMTVSPQSIPLVTDLAYVSCPALDTIYIVRTDLNMVCGSVGISGNPTTLVANLVGNRLFVLTPKDSAVKIFELTSNRLIDQIRIPLSVKSTYMTVSADGKKAFLLDEMGNNLLRLDLQTGTVDGQIRIGSRPKYMLYLEEQNLLAISCAYAQKIYFLDATSLTIVNTVDTGGTPDGLLERDNYLYVAESSSNSVSVFELPGGSNKFRVNVGIKPRRLVFGNSHIYISNYGSGNVSMLKPGQLNASRGIQVGGMPFEMDVSLARQWLYVGDEQKGGVAVIDLSSNKVAGWIELGAAPNSFIVVN